MSRARESSLIWLPLTIITLFLSISGLGYVAVPGPARFITFVHVPVILGGVLCGPLVGFWLGLTFGISNCVLYPPHDILMQVLPRALCGVVAALVFYLARKYGAPETQLTLGSLVAALAASYTNTLGVTLAGVANGSFQAHQILGILMFHGAPEALLAVLVTLPFAVTRHRR